MPSMTRTTTLNPAAAALWASAFVIAALVIIQAGRLPGNPAHAHVTADRGSYTLMTASNGRGPEAAPDEVLYVIDSREQTLLVYDIEDTPRRQLVLRSGYNLDEQFLRARQ